MALNFPSFPDTNEYFTDNTSGFTYQWNGIVWISVASTQTTALKEFDDISGSFNSSTTTFSLTFANGTTKVYPLSANQITIAIGGILQNAGDDFTISGDQITFTTAPDAGLTFQGMFYGSSVSMNSVAAGSITTSSLNTGGPIWNVGGDVTVAGIVTVGSSSVVIDGPSNEIRVGTGATINESGIIIGSGNPGIVTATEFHGDGSNLTIVAGIGTTGSVNTSGIITASSFTGSGIGLTNIGGQMHAILYSPGIAATGVGNTSNIVITFNKPVNPNTGTITLKEGAADGSTVESFDVFSDRITISGGQITIDPTSNFGAGTSYYVAMPAGAYKDILNTSSSSGISTYSFQTAPATASLWSWGQNTLGKLGLGDEIQRSSPTQIPGAEWENIEYGDHSAYALTTDGRFFAWGYNYGDLGQNDVVQYSSPVQIPGTQWSYIAHGNGSGFAIKTDGTLWACGKNGSGGSTGGALGQNDVILRSSPTQIPGTWSKVAGGSNSAFGIKPDGSLWSWGYNRDGQLVHNDTISRSSPTQVGSDTTWSSAMTHYAGSSRLLKTDGTLWCAGWNAYGGLGLNNQIEYSSPTQVGSDTTWSKLGEGESNNTFAIKTDGTLWSWGYNTQGFLGQNDVIPRSSPVQIPGTDWNQVSYTVATKTDGTLWGWGDNATGKLLTGDLIPRSSPVQIGSETKWTGDIQSFYSVWAIKGP